MKTFTLEQAQQQCKADKGFQPNTVQLESNQDFLKYFQDCLVALDKQGLYLYKAYNKKGADKKYYSCILKIALDTFDFNDFVHNAIGTKSQHESDAILSMLGVAKAEDLEQGKVYDLKASQLFTEYTDRDGRPDIISVNIAALILSWIRKNQDKTFVKLQLVPLVQAIDADKDNGLLEDTTLLQYVRNAEFQAKKYCGISTQAKAKAKK